MNLFPRLIESRGSQRAAVLEATPGHTLWGTLTDVPVRGEFYEDGRGFAVGGGRFFELYVDGTVTARGDVRNDGAPVRIVSNGLGGGQLFFVTGSQGYVYTLATNVLAPVTDDSFPVDPLMADFIDGYFVVMTRTAFYISTLEDGATWDGSDVAQRSQSPDQLVAILVDHEEIVLAGEHRIEFWRNTGASSFPFAPIEGAKAEIGIEAAHSLIAFDNSIVWLAQDFNGGRSVMRANAHNAERISTHALEAQVSAYANVLDAAAFASSEGGHLFYHLTFPSAGATWVYDASTKLWHERAYWNPTTGLYEAARPRCHVWAWGKHLVGDRQTGQIYRQGFDLQDENGSPRRWVRAFPHLSNISAKIFYQRLDLGLESGVGLLAGNTQDTNPYLEMRHTDNDGKTWSQPRPKAMGRIGVDTPVSWDRLGSSYKRVFEVSGSAAVKTVLLDATLEFTQGLH